MIKKYITINKATIESTPVTSKYFYRAKLQVAAKKNRTVSIEVVLKCMKSIKKYEKKDS